MKKLALLLMTLCLLGIASAQEYPEKLNNGKKLNKIIDFRGIYERIYDDVNNEDLVEICERTLRWPEFWKEKKEGEYELIYSIRNCQNLRRKNELTNFLNLENKNPQSFNIFWKNFQDRFKLERDLLRTENDLRRRTGLAYIFADGAEGQKDSPFDLISDLNEIDELFFGEKAEKPEIKFAGKTERELVKNIDATMDLWLNQVEKNHQLKNEEFKNYTNSLSGSLWRLGTKVFRENLNTYPLWTAHLGKTAGDAVDSDGVFGNSGMTAENHAIRHRSTDIPESIKSINPLSKLNSFNHQYLLEQSIIQIDANVFSITVNQLDKFNFAGNSLKVELGKSLNDFKIKISPFTKEGQTRSVKNLMESLSEDENFYNFLMFNKEEKIKETLNLLEEKLFQLTLENDRKDVKRNLQYLSNNISRLAANNERWIRDFIITHFKRKLFRENEKKIMITSTSSLSQLNDNFEFFREKLKIIRKKVFPPFLRKPVHSS